MTAEALRQHICSQTAQAYVRYRCRFNNHLFELAAKGLSIKRANRMIDDALAICGHPGYRLSKINWGAAAIEFLVAFTDGTQSDDSL